MIEDNILPHCCEVNHVSFLSQLYFVEHMKLLNAFSWSSALETAVLFVVMPLLGTIV